MNTFLTIPESKDDWGNPRVNIDHIISYLYVPTPSKINFRLVDGSTYEMFLENLDPKKVIKRIDSLMKIVKLDIKGTGK